MRRIYGIALAAIVATAGVNAHAQPERVGDFTLIDHKGMAHQLTRYGFQDALVFISQANGCSVNHENVANYKVLRTNYDHRNVGFFMINSSTKDERDAMRGEDSVYNYDFPILNDRTQLVGEDMGITHAGQIVVVDPTRRNVLYRGPLDVPQYGELREVLDEILEGTDTRSMETRVVDFEPGEGCEIEYPVSEQYASQAPDYATDVAPILIERCVGCHIEGGIGPFAMNSHQMVQGWSPMIRETVMTGRMPPMQVDPDIREWRNAGNLTVEETQTLIHWIDAGAPRE